MGLVFLYLKVRLQRTISTMEGHTDTIYTMEGHTDTIPIMEGHQKPLFVTQ